MPSKTCLSSVEQVFICLLFNDPVKPPWTDILYLKRLKEPLRYNFLQIFVDVIIKKFIAIEFVNLEMQICGLPTFIGKSSFGRTQLQTKSGEPTNWLQPARSGGWDAGCLLVYLVHRDDLVRIQQWLEEEE